METFGIILIIIFFGILAALVVLVTWLFYYPTLETTKALFKFLNDEQEDGRKTAARLEE